MVGFLFVCLFIRFVLATLTSVVILLSEWNKEREPRVR